MLKDKRHVWWALCLLFKYESFSNRWRLHIRNSRKFEFSKLSVSALIRGNYPCSLDQRCLTYCTNAWVATWGNFSGMQKKVNLRIGIKKKIIILFIIINARDIARLLHSMQFHTRFLAQKYTRKAVYIFKIWLVFK